MSPLGAVCPMDPRHKAKDDTLSPLSPQRAWHKAKGRRVHVPMSPLGLSRGSTLARWVRPMSPLGLSRGSTLARCVRWILGIKPRMTHYPHCHPSERGIKPRMTHYPHCHPSGAWHKAKGRRVHVPMSPLGAVGSFHVTLGLVPRVSLIARFSAFVAKNIQQVVHCGS
jgi:hypothetical protein